VVTALNVYLAPTRTAGQQVLRGVIYSDAGGKPGSLLGATEQLTFKSREAAAWRELRFATALELAPGSYWLGVLTGPVNRVAGFRYAKVARSRDYNANVYSAGPTATFGAASSDEEQMSLYAVYTPQPPPSTTFGKTSVGSSTGTFSFQGKRVSRYALTEISAIR
jgi:hypothetical protein